MLALKVMKGSAMMAQWLMPGTPAEWSLDEYSHLLSVIFYSKLY